MLIHVQQRLEAVDAAGHLRESDRHAGKNRIGGQGEGDLEGASIGGPDAHGVAGADRLGDDRAKLIRDGDGDGGRLTTVEGERKHIALGEGHLRGVWRTARRESWPACRL